MAEKVLEPQKVTETKAVVFHTAIEYSAKSPDRKLIVDNVKTMLSGKVFGFGDDNECLNAAKFLSIQDFKIPSNGLDFAPAGLVLGVTGKTEKTCSYSVNQISYQTIKNYADFVILANEGLSSAMAEIVKNAAPTNVVYVIED